MERSAVFEDVNLQLLQLCVGTIVEVSHDGCSVRIGPVQGVVRELTCDLLTSCGGDVGTPCVVMGDKVLVWPFAESGRGVVLGRVGTPARSSGEIAKPEDELVRLHHHPRRRQDPHQGHGACLSRQAGEPHQGWLGRHQLELGRASDDATSDSRLHPGHSRGASRGARVPLGSAPGRSPGSGLHDAGVLGLGGEDSHAPAGSPRGGGQGAAAHR